MEPTEGYVKILGFNLFYRTYGKPTKGTVLCLHGGPGATHDYLLSLEDLAQFGYRVVLIDQLGCGKSERPRSTGLYTIAHNVEEVEGVRTALRLGKVHLMGSSYGGALAIATALKYQRNLRSLIVTGGLASVPLTVREMRRLVNRLPLKVRATLAKYEAREEYRNPKYLAAVDVFYRRYVCRLPVWPREVTYSFDHMSGPVYFTMNGPNEFTIIGTIKDWDVTDQLPTIHVPTLVTVGRYDEVTPHVAESIHRGIKGSKLVRFERSAHLAMWEERSRYIEVLRDFLDGVRPT
ncbi:MAG TPA: proline iminopeptidase-family hydrolase [Thermoplasmata archaeon]|nr:proline iminopeptidase-family hydrolase [Thermoplasmata archaeon]